MPEDNDPLTPPLAEKFFYGSHSYSFEWKNRIKLDDNIPDVKAGSFPNWGHPNGYPPIVLLNPLTDGNSRKRVYLIKFSKELGIAMATKFYGTANAYYNNWRFQEAFMLTQIDVFSYEESTYTAKPVISIEPGCYYAMETIKSMDRCESLFGPGELKLTDRSFRMEGEVYENDIYTYTY